MADLASRVYPRDQRLLALLDEHLVLTTSQIAQALFGSPRTCRERLRYLKSLELLDSFTPPRNPLGGSEQTRWTLGRLGLEWFAAPRQQSAVTSRTADRWVSQLSRRPALEHLIGVNGLFTALMGVARRRDGCVLTRWWSETTTANHFLFVYPDGHGLWQQDGHVAGFFLEFDTGTEPLTRLVEKVPFYNELAAGSGPAYPVLFSLHSAEREANLHAALAGLAARVAVATTARPTPDPSAPVWAVAGHGLAARYRLADLPGVDDHGPNNSVNPNFVKGRLAADITGDGEYDFTRKPARKDARAQDQRDGDDGEDDDIQA